MAFRWGANSPQKFRSNLRTRQRVMERAAAGALGVGVTILEKELNRRIFPARRLNKQDAPGGRERTLSRRTPLRIRIDVPARTATISILPHYVFIRSRSGRSAVQAVLQRLGADEELLRTSLIVKGRRLSFRAHPKLEAWARRPDKGRQIQRHVARLARKEAFRILQMTPALIAAEPRFKDLARKAFRKGLGR